MNKKITCPSTLAEIKDLKVGDVVSVSGKIYTGRDRLHKYLYEGGKCPVDLNNGAIYHCGPIAVRTGAGWMLRGAGPTTSIRQDPYMAKIIKQYNLKVIIGKGGMGIDTRKACVEFGCVYLQAVGGTATLMAKSVRSVDNPYFFKEFGMADALWGLQVEDLKTLVAIDTRGRVLHNKVERASKKALKTLLAS